MTGELCDHKWEPIDHCLGMRWQCRWCLELAFDLPGTPAVEPLDGAERTYKVRAKLMILAMMLALAIPAFAQDTPTGGGVCCKAPGGETTYYAQLRTCPAGTVPVTFEECGMVSPTPVPTVAPEPTPWEPPKETNVPAWLTWLLGILANKYTLPIAFGSVVIAVVAGAKQLLALFGSKLGPKANYLVPLLVSFLTALGEAVTDGKIAGEEWSILLTTLATFVAATLGYKLLFGGQARARIGK